MPLFTNTFISDQHPTKEELTEWIERFSHEDPAPLFQAATDQCQAYYNNEVYARGLIEMSNVCSRSCAYCGLRKENQDLQRYTLSDKTILECCQLGHKLGYRTFVLQSGENPALSDKKMVPLVQAIKERYPDCALTLSLGERSFESLSRLKAAGADRYLLRHETASKGLYDALHPGMTFERRLQMLRDLKALDYQVGAGFMVGLPGQTDEDLAKDLLLLKEFEPEMIGIGPFIPHPRTPLANAEGGTLEKTLIMIALTRLLLPKALLPATTAMGTLHPQGRELALKAGANVVMPNLSPTEVRKHYELYTDKICLDDRSEHCRHCIEGRIASTGRAITLSRGDHYDWR